MDNNIKLLRHFQIITNESNGTIDINYYKDTFNSETDIRLPQARDADNSGYDTKKVITSVGATGREHRFEITTVTGSTKPKIHSIGMLLKDYRIDTTDISDLGEPAVPYFLEISTGYYLEISTDYKLRIS